MPARGRGPRGRRAPDLERLRALVEQQGRLIEEQGKRLDALERQNRDLRVCLAMSALAPRRPVALAALGTNTLAAAPAGASATSPARYAFTKPNGFEVVPYGYFKFDAILDSAHRLRRRGRLCRSRKPLGRRGQGPHLQRRETRLGFNAPDAPNVKVTGRLEADLRRPRKPGQLPVQAAYIDAAWGDGWSVRLGQDWDAHAASHPKMPDAGILAGTGHLYGRARSA